MILWRAAAKGLAAHSQPPHSQLYQSRGARGAAGARVGLKLCETVVGIFPFLGAAGAESVSRLRAGVWNGCAGAMWGLCWGKVGGTQSSSGTELLCPPHRGLVCASWGLGPCSGTGYHRAPSWASQELPLVSAQQTFCRHWSSWTWCSALPFLPRSYCSYKDAIVSFLSETQLKAFLSPGSRYGRQAQ